MNKYYISLGIVVLVVTVLWGIYFSFDQYGKERILEIYFYHETEAAPLDSEEIPQMTTVVTIVTTKNKDLEEVDQTYYISATDDLDGKKITALEEIRDGAGGTIIVFGPEIVRVKVSPSGFRKELIRQEAFIEAKGGAVSQSTSTRY